MTRAFLLANVKKQWPKIEKKLLKNLQETEVDAINDCFLAGGIPPAIAEFFQNTEPDILTHVGDEAQKVFLPKVAIEFYYLAKNYKKVREVCLRILSGKAITTDGYFVIGQLNGILDLDVKFDAEFLEKIESIIKKLPKKGAKGQIRQHLEEFLFHATHPE